jgi:hypothetical protein
MMIWLLVAIIFGEGGKFTVTAGAYRTQAACEADLVNYDTQSKYCQEAELK